MKPGGAADAATLRAGLEARVERIAYTPLWTELFDRMLAVAHAGEPPQTLLDGLGDDSRGEERFRCSAAGSLICGVTTRPTGDRRPPPDEPHGRRIRPRRQRPHRENAMRARAGARREVLQSGHGPRACPRDRDIIC